MRRPKLGSLMAALALLVLSACASVEEKVERLFAESQELAAAGDTERALLVLRSLFDLDGEHLEARSLYADLQRADRNYEQAYRHYLLLTEQYPGHIEARLSLAEIAFEIGEWSEVRRHAEAAARIDPDDPRLAAITGAINYRDLTRARDEAAVEEVIEAARARLATRPDDLISRRVVIDHAVRLGDQTTALEQIDVALQIDPIDMDMNRLKLQLLAELQDMPAIGDQLKTMVQRFPDDDEARTSLIRWYLAVDDAAGAEAFLRQRIAESGDDIAPRVALVQFLQQVQGSDAAIAEVDARIEEGLDNTLFRTMRASLVYDTGDVAQAIEDMRTVVAEAPEVGTGLDARIALARMLSFENDRAQAETLVDAVLEFDEHHVEALKMRASWLIDDDRVRDAVLALRTALDQAPQDPETMTLLARAYERDGNSELMSESLARAFEASNAAPAETLRYARLLIRNEKYLSAEDVLLRAVRFAPDNLVLLQTLAEVYLVLSDWPRTEQVISALREIDTEDSVTLATELQAVLFQRLQRSDESISLLRNVIDEGRGGVAAQAAVIRTHIANGEIGQARSYLDELLAGALEDEARDGLEFLNGALLAVEGRYDAAQAQYRSLLERDPQSELVWRALIATQVREGEPDAARITVDEALAAIPDSPTLLWIKAGFAETAGDFEAAIAIYEDLYQQDSGSTVVANNLASLLTTYRSDNESLQRAFVIARRLRGSRLPAFQDTYGWISYRLGNFSDALEHLEPAARGLPEDPVVQYHLGMLYAALERPQDAAEQFRKAIALWDGEPGPLAADAALQLARIETATEDGAAPQPVESP